MKLTLALMLVAAPAVVAQSPPSVSAACEVYGQYFAAMRTPVPPTVVMGAKAKAMTLVGDTCSQPSHAPDSALSNVLQATNLLAVTKAHYPGATP